MNGAHEDGADALPVGVSGVVAARSNVLTDSAVDPDRFLLFNGFTGALIELDAEDHGLVHGWLTAPASPVPVDLPEELGARLRGGGFVVPADFDEVATLERLRASRSRTHLSLTLAPTLQCNFRCTYCFEEHRQERMGPEVEEALRHFVAERLPHASRLSITWFGGEPLLELDLLERTQRFLRQAAEAAGIPRSFGLVTNGWFLTDDTVARLAALGPWRHFQVTLDGAAAQHDQRRVLLGGQPTFARLVANVARAVEAGIGVSVRVNVDKRNADELDGLLDALEEAAVLPRARVYLGQVNDSTEVCAHVEEHVLSRRDFARTRLRFEALLLQRGLSTSVSLPRPQCENLCVADNPNGYSVGPSGLLFKCWHEIHLGPDEAVGHLDGGSTERTQHNLASWEGYAPLERSGCRSCFAVATCMGGCPWEAARSPGEVGSCGDYRFFPEQIVRVAHLDMVERGRLRAPEEDSA